MKIVHIVSSISSTNFGVWNAAIFGSQYLKKQYGISSELWICSKSKSDTIVPEIPYYYFSKEQMKSRGLKIWISSYHKDETVFVTHGAWLKPTNIGYKAKRAGFKWIYLSQGMFEPWSLENGWIKKRIYFALFERPMCRHADIIRAVSKPEEYNLKKLFNNPITLIYNGVKFNSPDHIEKSHTETIFLFLARLHHKKGIVPLVKAWYSKMMNSEDVRLLIVGPDEGELKKIESYLGGNMEYLGPVFGDEKKKLLRRAHYYVMPTFSEGFPSSVVEAMSFGAIPIVSDGANFPEIFDNELGYKVTTNEQNIADIINRVSTKEYDIELSDRNIAFVKNHLTEEIIGDRLHELYRRML